MSALRSGGNGVHAYRRAPAPDWTLSIGMGVNQSKKSIIEQKITRFSSGLDALIMFSMQTRIAAQDIRMVRMHY
jgi:hypothetical protein